MAHKVHKRPKDDTSDDEESSIIVEDHKDQQTIKDALERMKERRNNRINVNLINMKTFLWEIMCVNGGYKNEIENENEIQRKDSENKNEEKENNNNKSDDNGLSQLIYITKKEMCKYGHGFFSGNSDYIKDNKCIECKGMNERKFCYDCWNIYYQRTDYEARPNKSDYILCIDCRQKHSEKIRKKIKLDTMKAAIIRNELLDNPSFEMDLLCNMSRR
eukprot:400748_1